jgi:hypothetical protein
MEPFSNINRAIHEGYTFQFNNYIQRGFTIVHKNAGLFIVASLLFFIMTIATSFMTGLVGGALALTGGIMGFAVQQVLGQVVQSAVSAPMIAGINNGAQLLDRNKHVELGDFFEGFKKWTDLFVTSLLVAMVMLIASVPGIYLLIEAGLDLGELNSPEVFEMLKDLDTERIGLAGLVTSIPVIYLMVAYLWAPLLTWFYGIKGWQALETSRQLAQKNFFSVLGLLLFAGFFFIIGFLLCGVGALYTYPVSKAMVYAAFADVVKLNQNNRDFQNSDDIFAQFEPKE